ncbi:PRTRC system protein C [uncultured Flavobacterium sp.]|uniref:PRTRC system protein C n=1 Tax=uncultured Flavobacterium sp. TaxID=165435 RepID=UPI0025D49D9D|nr:PRTRC system protein C [uncultured Flavobacterium sp.]
MMTTSQMPRVFLMKEKGNDISLSDPDTQWSTDAVLQFYANTYPILTTAKISGPVIHNDTVQYTFESMMGTKG